MGVKATIKTEITAIETLDGTRAPFAWTKDKTITHNGLNRTTTLDGQTTPPITEHAAFELALTAGAATIDLRALPGTNGGLVDCNGHKVQAIKIVNKAGNANPMTIGEGASNGYELMGDGWEITLQPGQEITLYGNNLTPAVGASAKTIDVSGTGTQVIQVQVVAG